MEEEQFTTIPGQGSIYSAVKLGDQILVATGDQGKVYAYSLDSNTNDFTVEEIHLYDLPRKA